jgi:regulator of protease activity HflC (stomatin/prohibitin superfamily)
VSAEVRREMEQYGVRMAAIAIKDIILPGDIREILNQVVAAEKQAQANLIRRREETAATRSLLNTAKLMEDNPLLVRMKELETLEKIAEKVEKIHVFGGLRGLLE